MQMSWTLSPLLNGNFIARMKGTNAEPSLSWRETSSFLTAPGLPDFSWYMIGTNTEKNIPNKC
jgi:hypothetical protein